MIATVGLSVESDGVVVDVIKAPFAGITRSRFNGYVLSHCPDGACGTPGFD
jgi:hypothetical protein